MYTGQSSSMFKTQRNKNMKHFSGPTTQTKMQDSTKLWKTAQKISLIVFDTSALFDYFSFFNQIFCFAFQSSFGHYFLIVRTIIFLFFILFIYLKTCVYGSTLIVTDVEIYLYEAE